MLTVLAWFYAINAIGTFAAVVAWRRYTGRGVVIAAFLGMAGLWPLILIVNYDKSKRERTRF